MRRAGALVRVSRVPGCPQPRGTAGGPRSPRRSGPACAAGEARGSAESTPARTLPRACSVRPGNFLPSRERPRPPRRPLTAKLEAVGAGVAGARPPPVALWRPGSGHRLCPARGASLFRRPRGWQRRRGCHPRAPRPGRRPGGQRPGGAAACRADPLAVRSPRARTRCRAQAAWKGVCERGALGALLAVTSHTKPGFQTFRSVEGRGALRIVQPLLERHQGARCSGDAGTRRRIRFAEMPEAKCR